MGSPGIVPLYFWSVPFSKGTTSLLCYPEITVNVLPLSIPVLANPL